MPLQNQPRERFDLETETLREYLQLTEKATSLMVKPGSMLFEEAYDAARDVLIRCIKNQEVATLSKEAFKNYLFRSIKNAIIDIYRKHVRRRTHAQLTIEDAHLAQPANEGPETQLANRELLQIANEAMSEDELRILTSGLQGESDKELSDTYGVAASTIRVRRTRLRGRLRDLRDAA